MSITTATLVGRGAPPRDAAMDVTDNGIDVLPINPPKKVLSVMDCVTDTALNGIVPTQGRPCAFSVDRHFKVPGYRDVR